jgi:hypothetical protein
LCAEPDVRDETTAWSWDYLYTSLCGELRHEQMLADGQDMDDDDAPPPSQPPVAAVVTTKKRVLNVH